MTTSPPPPVSEAREYLFGLTLHGIKLGLDNITQLLALIGNPQHRFPAIHVAGTNGKGSVLAFLDSMLRAAGYRTGRFTSPHLIDVTERFLLSGTPIGEETMASILLRLRDEARSLPHAPTFFEMTTAVAFEAFAREAVELGLIETGMGGRLDSTNVLQPIVTAITPVDLDHMAYLGDNLAAIAGEKAGIIKSGGPVVIGPQAPEALEVLLETATRLGAPTCLADRDFRFGLDDSGFSYCSDALSLSGCTLGLKGGYQAQNAAMAVALAEQIAPQFPRLTTATIQQGLAEARWPGRLEQVMESPPVILDVAHNPAGARQLAQNLGQATVVLAMSGDKDGRAMIAALQQLARPFILSAYTGHRALPLDALVAMAEEMGIEEYLRADSIPEAIALGLQHADENHPLLITGSIFTVGEARAYLIESGQAPPLQF